MRITLIPCLPILCVTATLLAGCGTKMTDRETGGAATGAGAGAVLGILGGPIGIVTGAMLGASVGVSTGALASPNDINLGAPPWSDK